MTQLSIQLFYGVNIIPWNKTAAILIATTDWYDKRWYMVKSGYVDIDAEWVAKNDVCARCPVVWLFDSEGLEQ